MVDRASRWVLGLALVALACGCSSNERPLLLDQICRNRTMFGSATGTGVPNCRLTGDAAFIAGVSADSQAVRLGPEGGTLEILIAALTAPVVRSSWSLDVLAATNRPEGSSLFRSLTWGSCGAACPPDPGDVEAQLDEDFQWAEVVVDEAGVSSIGTNVPGDAVVILRGADVDIVDIRTPGFDPEEDVLVPR